MFRTLGVACFSALLSAQASLTAARADEFAFTDDDLIILRLQTSRFVLSDGVIGYRRGETACVSLEDIAAGLDFPIIFDELGAEGWFIREDRRFSLDYASRTVRLDDGKRAPLREGRLYLEAGFPCISPSAIREWFALDATFDFENALVTVRSEEALPVEEREARKKRRGETRSDPVISDPSVQHPVMPYAWSGWPVADASFSGSVGEGGTVLRGDILATGDILKLGAEVYASVDSRSGLDAVRAVLGRRSAAGGLLGSLDLTEFAFGDIISPANRLSAGAAAGRGMLFSSFPLDQPTMFDVVDLQGDLPAGWEVELYRNGVLLNFSMSRDDGRYSFQGVPLLFGRNEFRLAFYGPQGQRREQYREYYVGENLLAPGNKNYFLALSQERRSLLGFSEFADAGAAGRLRLNARVDYGLSRRLTVGAGVSSLNIDGRRRTYLDGAVRTVFGPVSMLADASADLGGGRAAGLMVQGTLAGLNLTAAHEIFDSYESENAPKEGGAFLRDRSTLRADFAVKPASSVSLPVALLVRRRSLADGDSALDATFRTSTALAGISASNEIVYAATSRDGAWTGTMRGAALISRMSRLGSLRAELLYDITPSMHATRASASLEIPVRERLNLRFDGGYDLVGRRATTGAAINFRLDQVAIGAFARYGGGGAVEAGFSLSTSLMRNPLNGKTALTSRNIARSGIIAARAFIDEDGDDAFSEGDRPLEGAGFTVNGRAPQHADAAADGAWFPGVPVYEPVRIGIDMQSVDDPYLVGPQNAPAALSLRPGTVAVVDIPLQRSGEIAGLTLLRDKEGARVIGGVEMELIAENGAIVAATVSEFDGFFVFERIPFGTYSLRVAPAQIERASLIARGQHHIEVSRRNDVIENLRFELERVVIAPSSDAQ